MSWAAHELESYLLRRHIRLRISFSAILAGALLPDMLTKGVAYGLHVGPIDVGPPVDPAQWHRGWPGAGGTTSLTFGVLAALAVLWWTGSREWSLGLLVGIWAHVFTDAFDSVGVMLFFPFTTQRYSVGAWAYSAQAGRQGDAAAYYSGLGGIWDLFWLLLVLLSWRVLTRRFFYETILPSDPLLLRLRRRFRLSDRMLVAVFRAYFFYGACRAVAWFVWARVSYRAPLDLTWGGPHWVHAEPGPHWAWPGSAVNTVVGLDGLVLLAVVGLVLTARFGRDNRHAPECRSAP